MLSDLYTFFNNQFNYRFDGKRSSRGFSEFYEIVEEGEIRKFNCLMEKEKFYSMFLVEIAWILEG